MLCPECKMEMFQGVCITLGCPRYQAFPALWQVEEQPDQEDDLVTDLWEGNNLA